MSLRMKLLLAQAPLVVALVISGMVGTAATTELGRSAQLILQDNYRSVLAAQRMMDAVERMDSAAALLALRHETQGSIQATESARAFEDELRVEEHNITEAGEQETAARLRARWTHYQQLQQHFLALPDREAQEAFYFAQLQPAFGGIKEVAQAVLAVNQDAMMRKSDLAQRTAKRLHSGLLAVAVLGCLLGLVASTVLIRRLLRPLLALGLAARRIGEGHVEVRAAVHGSDEIAQLAQEFNAMAEQVHKYRQSSLGELLEAQQAVQATLDSLPDPVVGLSLDGHLLHVNRSAEDVLGLHPVPGAGDPLAALDPAVRAAVVQARDHVLGGRGSYVPRSLEESVRVERAEGPRHLLAHAAPIYAEDRSVQGVTVVLKDITRLLRLDEIKNNVVATVAHEFRTPLTSLRMALHLCLEGAAGPLTARQEDLLYAGREDCERLQTTVDELLDMSRLQSGHLQLRLQDASVERLVQEAVDAHAHGAADRHVGLDTEFQPGVDTVPADAERVHLVLSNLLANAIRYSPPGSRVRVRTQREDAAVRFAVTDQGPGIAPEQQETIFDKHIQGSSGPPGSAGLGLFIAREIIHAHGGRMGVDSAPDQGSTFWFTLPLTPAAAA